jgi:hypothetical protein
MATINYVPYVSSSYFSHGQPLTKWGQALHDIGQQQTDPQLWKQHQNHGVFNASSKFGFTGMLSRLQSQRRTNR